MKSMWFHLMPYTQLPEDFRTANPSVWVNIYSSLFDPRHAYHMHNESSDELEYATECGFYAVCVNGHQHQVVCRQSDTGAEISARRMGRPLAAVTHDAAPTRGRPGFTPKPAAE